MSRGESGDGRESLDGLSVETAVTAVDDERNDPDRVRETLAIVARDGTVRRAAVDDALANASKVVTTAETRTELAAKNLADVRETAEPVSDVALVSKRVDDFAARLDTVEDRRDALADDVREILARRDDGELYELARRLRRVTAAASEVQRAADDLQFELDSFEEWLTDADRRAAELTDDVDAFAESVSELDGTVDDIAADDADPENGTARRWAAATVHHRVTSLMLSDLRAELAALRTLADREGTDPPSGIEPRLDELQARHEAVGERLADSAEPRWPERFDDQLTALDEALDGREPPVAWAEVEALVEEHCPDIEQ
ncbi:halo transducer protein [Halorubrum sp. CBA1125]|uniref:halo transducer protein n=1 Tax=Halorubrum sp. CBA1125 TaxID=2668072 RepID=UPI0012E8EACB|nr:halo transducer protein [Halorubrum sp. CBA1125]MUW14164.1 halo transducer protein [Halorubrum sp. CBA1125]